MGLSQEDMVKLTKISFLLSPLSQAKVMESVESPRSTLLSKRASWKLLGFGHTVCYSTLKNILLGNL